MANKHSIMTREMVESFCNSYYIPDEVHPTAPGRDRTITQFPEGKVGVYTRLFDYCGYRIPLTKFFVSILKYFRIHISQLSPFGAARISHFEVLTRVLDLGPSVAVFRAFYTRMYSDGLFSFAKRSLSAPSCLSKPPDSIKNWADHFFWVDSGVSLISVPLYTGGVLEKDPAPHLTARQEQAVQVLSSNKAPFRRYPECFLALVGLSPYYPFGENTYPAFEGPDRTDMGLLDYIRTADPRKVQTVEVQKGEEQVTLFDSIKHCFVSLDAPAAAHQASGSGSGAGAEVSAPSVEGNVVEENVIPESAFLNPTDPEFDVTVAEKDVAQRQPEKAKRKKLLKRSDPLPAKRLRIDHPSLASGTGGKSLASLRQSLPEGSLTLGASSPADIPTHVTVSSSCAADAPVYTTADIVTSSRGKTLVLPTSGVGGSSQPETSEESTDSFYETAVLNSEDAKRWYIPRWNITNDSLLDDGFSCRTLVDRVAPPGFFSTLRNMDYDQLFEEFNVGAARQICLGSEVRSRAEHELELKEKLRGKYDARGVLLREKDAEIARLKSLLEEKETESAEVLRLRDQVSVLAADKSLLSAEVSALKNVVSQKDTNISLLDSRASYLKSVLDDSQAACGEAMSLISSLSSERDGLASEVSTLHSAFSDFKEKMEAQQEEQAQELYNRVAELEAHVMDVSGRLEGEFYPAYLRASLFLADLSLRVRVLACLISAGMRLPSPYVNEKDFYLLFQLDHLLADVSRKRSIGGCTAKSADNVVPYELLHLITGDGCDGLCFNPFSEVIDSNNKIWTLHESYGKGPVCLFPLHYKTAMERHDGGSSSAADFLGRGDVFDSHCIPLSSSLHPYALSASSILFGLLWRLQI
ncbi:hypothetical protein Tco_0179341 [Tanacetum coccineum]